MTRRRDAVVVGGGLAGASFAVALAQAGRDVTVVERQPGPHDKVCGEFLSGQALGRLQALGVDAATLGAVPIDAVAISRGRFRARRALPFAAASLSRRRLDEALLARAQAAGAEVLRGVAARSIACADGRWEVALSSGEALAAEHVALATGKHDLRGEARPPGRQNDLIGFKRHARLAPGAAARLGRTVRIGFFPGGYAGLEPVERGRANLCLVVRSAVFAALGRDWSRLLDHVSRASPDLGVLLDDAEGLREAPLAVARIPYGLVRREADGVWRLGDQAAVIPCFAGEGMSIALASAARAAAALLRGEPPDRFQAAFARAVASRVGLATSLSRALVRPGPQQVVAALAALVPQGLAAVAEATRIRRDARAEAA